MNLSNSPSPKLDLFDVMRVRYVERVAIFAIVAGIFGFVATIVSDIPEAQKLAYSITVVVLVGFNLLLLFLLRRGQVELVSNAIVLELLLGPLISVTSDLHWLTFSAMIAVSGTALLAGKWLYRFVNTVIWAVFIAVIVGLIQTSAGLNTLTAYITILLAVIIVSTTTRYFVSQTQQSVHTARSSNTLLQAAAETGQILSKMLSLRDILPRAINLISERFDYYHVQVFLIDKNGKDAQLVASTGEIGRQLVARHHSLPVGSQSVIGRTTASGQPVIARDTDSTYYRNELLPSTRSELAIPIFDGDKIIGALDVQSRSYEVFGEDVVQALQVMANLLGTTIRNARLFEDQEKSAQEVRKLYQESESNLREIQRLNQHLSRAGWEDYLGAHQEVTGITLNNDRAVMNSQWTDTLLKAGQTRQTVVEERDQQGVIAVPMVLGNEVIGAVEIEADPNIQRAEISEMVSAVAQRLALSLDKARLFEESQETAAREQRINEIVARFQTVNNVDDLLRITLEEVSHSLGAKRGVISLTGARSTNGNGEHRA
ncbi:MAG: GAF domain-containing protein [Anaerolineae bacterium]